MRDNMKKQSGQTLLEALIALATAVVIISAMTVIVLSSLGNAQFSKNQNQATQYAQQGIEFLKNLSQSNWSTFSAYNLTNYCMPSDNSLPPKTGQDCGSPPNNVGIFSREVAIRQSSDSLNTCSPPANSALVTVSVGWSDNKCTSATDVYCHKIKLISCIYNSPAISPP